MSYTKRGRRHLDRRGLLKEAVWPPSPRNTGGEGRSTVGARSRAVGRVPVTTSGPGCSPWGGGFRDAMIPPAASSGVVPAHPPLSNTLKGALDGGGSLWSLFFLSLLLQTVLSPPTLPSTAPSALCAQPQDSGLGAD